MGGASPEGGSVASHLSAMRAVSPKPSHLMMRVRCSCPPGTALVNPGLNPNARSMAPPPCLRPSSREATRCTAASGRLPAAGPWPACRCVFGLPAQKACHVACLWRRGSELRHPAALAGPPPTQDVARLPAPDDGEGSGGAGGANPELDDLDFYSVSEGRSVEEFPASGAGARCVTVLGFAPVWTPWRGQTGVHVFDLHLFGHLGGAGVSVFLRGALWRSSRLPGRAPGA